MKKHTDSGFTFDIQGDHAVVMEIDGNPQIVEIPGEIDGVPVTELAEYLFSGKSCQVIRIPSGVWKIGRYGFYNCRELEELWFSSDFTDLGSGAFTGCHKIRRMEVQMNSQESGLKEILSEVGEELQVHLYGEVEAMLWFPEYYEEGVENTPARILMTEVHLLSELFSGKSVPLPGIRQALRACQGPGISGFSPGNGVRKAVLASRAYRQGQSPV